MNDLTPELAEGFKCAAAIDFTNDSSIMNLVNTVVTEETDFEHIITFLEATPSSKHQKLARRMKEIFEDVLRNRLDLIEKELHDDRVALYRILLDMYNINGFKETLSGIITTNYDEFIEDASDHIDEYSIDFGIRVDPLQPQKQVLRLIKLHGSFGWQASWPVSREPHGVATLWIPPGINKENTTYPFNVLWGLARELLSCDIVRIIGCHLGPNDWDLLSLLFATRHGHQSITPRLEIIDSPCYAEELKTAYPYLQLSSILEIDTIGSQIIAEYTGWMPTPYANLTYQKQREALDAVGKDRNWFELWLTHKVESISWDVPHVKTDAGFVDEFLNA